MWRYIVGMFLGLVSLPGLASAETADRWTVQSSSGEVSVAAGSEWRSLAAGQILSAPFTVKTGTTGQVTLVRGEDLLVLVPQSRILVKAVRRTDDGLLTRIIQSLGNIVYQVEKRSRQRFEVETPYLVSVVKGTTFTISVTEGDTAVSLAEGSLEVVSKDGVHRALLVPGEIARHIKGVRGIQVSNAALQQSRWGAWHPANSRRSAARQHRSGPGGSGTYVVSPVVGRHGVSDSDSGRIGTAPGQSGGTPGLSATAPGLSGGPPGLDRTPPGLSGGPPGLTGTAPGLLGGPPGLTRTAPGRSGSAPGLNR